MSNEIEQDLLALALGDDAAPHTFVFKGKTFEVRVPSLKQQEAIKRQANEPVLENGKPTKVNGVPVTQRNEAKFTALMLIASIFPPGEDKPVFQKVHLDSLMSKSPARGTFIVAAQDAILEAMQGAKGQDLAEEEEGNSAGAHGSDS